MGCELRNRCTSLWRRRREVDCPARPAGLLLGAFEYHFPDTVITFEGPFKHVPGEGAGEVLESNCRAKRTILGQGTADVLRPTLELDLTNSHLVADSDRNGGRSTSTGRGGR